jgi:foldase protein PrsA
MQGRYAALLVSPTKDRRIVAAVVLAALLIVMFVWVAVAQGIGDPSVPSGNVALVEDAPDGEISQEEYDQTLEQVAASQGVREVPPESDPQYAALRDSAVSDLLLGRWVRGEAEERGLTVSESEITNQLEQFIEQDFGGQKQYERFLEQSNFTEEEARARVELGLLSDELQQVAFPEAPDVSGAEIEEYYEANRVQFEQPETRDVRQILNEDQAKVEQAKALLEEDDSPENWKKVAARFSTEDATKDVGGLVEGVTEDEREEVIADQIYSAEVGELVGPVKGGENEPRYHLIQVEKITPAEVTPLADVTEQIQQQIVQGKEQQIAQDFQTDFLEKWTSRSFCADDYLVNRCANYEAPKAEGVPGAPPVLSRPVVPPGQATVFPGQPPPVLPQGPQGEPVELQDQIIGPAGAPVTPGGAPAPAPAPAP